MTPHDPNGTASGRAILMPEQIAGHDADDGRVSGPPATQATRQAGPSKKGRRPWPRRARRGLANVLLTAAIVAGVLVFLLSIYSRVNTSIRTQTTQTTLTAFVAEIRRSFANARQFTDEDYHEILASRMPGNALRGAEGDETLVTAWGGKITGSGGTTIGTGTDHNIQFWIRVDDLPQSACETLATSFLNRRDVTGVHVGSAETVGTALTTRVAIEDGCDATTDDNTVGVVFRG